MAERVKVLKERLLAKDEELGRREKELAELLRRDLPSTPRAEWTPHQRVVGQAVNVLSTAINDRVVKPTTEEPINKRSGLVRWASEDLKDLEDALKERGKRLEDLQPTPDTHKQVILHNAIVKAKQGEMLTEKDTRALLDAVLWAAIS